MSELDILFWLFILLLIGLGYAIEAGLANQHRRLLLSTMGSVTLASIYLMFAVEDTSSFDATRPAVQAEDEGEDGELGVFEFGGKKKKQKTASSSSPPSQSGAAKGPSEKERLKGPFSDCEGCPMMVPVQGRNFTLGSPLTEAGRADTEGPPRGVRVGDFTIGQYEVTREQYEMFVKETNYVSSRTCDIGGRRVAGSGWQNPGIAQSPKHPVVCVSWKDARSFVAWLKKKTGKPYRLPSEVEWEFVARAGSTHAYFFGPQFLPGQANAQRHRNGTAPVGDFGFNKFMVADVHGNAWELLEDCWSADLSFLPADGRSLGILGDCSQRAIRGGGWDSPIEHVRSATRGAAGENAALNSVGFRVARDFVEEPESALKKK